MDTQSSTLTLFKNQVGLKFQLYNSLFTSLPFHRIEKTGILLSLFLTVCEDGYKKKQSPMKIIEDFFEKQTTCATEAEKVDLMFRFVQYVERQVVLFDALEDAAFRDTHDMNGVGTLRHLVSEVLEENKEQELAKLLTDFGVRFVLTAHPTQFYPGPVLAIINDLADAVIENDSRHINMYLQQLGKTPFFKKTKPSPYDEALSLIWYMENVFYPASGRILSYIKTQFPNLVAEDHQLIQMGFWPGGDRDGNPFVTADTTLKVAEALRAGIIKCYYQDVRRIKRRLTFKDVENVLAELETKLYNNIFVPGEQANITAKDILTTLKQIKETIVYQHNGLFVQMVENLINKVEIFGLHFASLDVRQESTVHSKVLAEIAEHTKALPANYALLNEGEKIEALSQLSATVTGDDLKTDIAKDTINTAAAIRQIQLLNGEHGCNRYIISQCNSALNAMEVFGVLLLSGWKKDAMKVDIVPLFETIDDLKNAAAVMKQLYDHPVYRKHLKKRHNKQTIMLGFSDGTKDGGYLMANWSIYKAKEELTRLSKPYEIEVIFFDGRGGPPARGGGKTHKFYASMGKNISNKSIQLTIQGQTVSSNFGTVDAAQFNIEQLIHAGISNSIFSKREFTLEKREEELLQKLAELSFESFTELKNHPEFLTYLLQISPLRFYSETNIGSRPAKRGAGSKMTLKDLRAIPFVGAWSQLKQNVTGYYGVGSALKEYDEKGKWTEVKSLYENSLFVKTLIDNCEMSMKKCYFPLTMHLANHPVFGEIWNMIYSEYELTEKYLFKLTGKTELMSDYPVEQLSIQVRERIVLPLLTIQQFAINRVREIEERRINTPIKATYEKLIMRCSFGIINAGRNSA